MKIEINSIDLNRLEKVTYEYQASINILSYLMKQDYINETYLNEYLKKSELYFSELKILQTELVKKYSKNKHIKKYYFNFIDSTLNIEEEK